MLAIIDLRVALVAVVCIAASLALAVLTAWFWRNARLETPVLAPLEVMGERRFKNASHERRQELLDEVRGLTHRPRPVARPTRMSTAPAVVDELFDDELAVDYPIEEMVGDEQPHVPMIDPLLGRRNN